MDDTLELAAAADELGVHYQTAYRWVRSGRLPARLVAGKYRIARADLDAVEAARATPSEPSPPRPARLDRQAERMRTALTEGDEATARRIARRLAAEGAPVVDLVQTVLAPALRDIGQAWHDGELTIWAEHRASAIVERILGDLAPNPRGRRRGTAMVAAVAGDQHSLPTTMAAVALRDRNWHVHHLGAGMPPDELVRFCAVHDIDVAVLSVTNLDAAPTARRAANALEQAGVPTVVGAPGRTLDELTAAVHEAAPRSRGPGR